jgi:signal transduction histidine kinase
MNESTLDLESELRISPRPVLAVLVILGVGFYFAAEMLSLPWETVEQGISLFLLLSTLSVIGSILVGWRPVLGRWFAILALVVAVHLGGWWLYIPGSLAWAVIPVALAAPLVGLPAAVATAVGESAIVLSLMGVPAMEAGLSDAIVALIAIWGVFGGICAMHYRLHRRSLWLIKYIERAQRALWDAQDRRAELRQALDDLTYANRQLVLMNERVAGLRAIAEESQKAKTAFVAKVSHEFRTPLNMIVGLVDLMIETPPGCAKLSRSYTATPNTSPIW